MLLLRCLFPQPPRALLAHLNRLKGSIYMKRQLREPLQPSLKNTITTKGKGRGFFHTDLFSCFCLVVGTKEDFWKRKPIKTAGSHFYTMLRKMPSFRLPWAATSLRHKSLPHQLTYGLWRMHQPSVETSAMELYRIELERRILAEVWGKTMISLGLMED